MKDRYVCIFIAILLPFIFACDSIPDNIDVNKIDGLSSNDIDNSYDVTVERSVDTADSDNVASVIVKESFFGNDLSELQYETVDNSLENNGSSDAPETDVLINEAAFEEPEEMLVTGMDEPPLSDMAEAASDHYDISLNDFEIVDVVQTMIVVKSAIIRKGPSSDFDILGSLEVGDVIVVTGECENGWYRFEINSEEGFANKKFFIDKETYELSLEEKQTVDEETEGEEPEASQDGFDDNINIRINEY